MAVEAVEASEVEEANEGNEAAEVFKVWKITMEDFKAILVLEFNNLRTKTISFWCFDRIMKTHAEFSGGGCWGQPKLNFWKLVDETQISRPQEYTVTF
jgi:hypothetical protein